MKASVTMDVIKLLLADDDENARASLARRLRRSAKFEVDESATAAELMQHIASSPDAYTALILDYTFDPDMPTEDILDRLQRDYSRLPVIVFTGMDPEGGMQTLAKGAYRYLRRPIDFTELVNLIRNLKEQSAVFRELARDVRNIVGADLCIAWQFNRKTNKIRVVGWSGDLDDAYRHTVILEPQFAIPGALFERGKALFFPDVKDENSAPGYEFREEAIKRGWTSLFSIPLMHERRVIGLVDAYTLQPYPGTDADVERLCEVILPPLARQASEAIRKAELHRRMQALQGLNQLLVGHYEEDALIRQLLAKALDLVGAGIGWLFLKDLVTGRIVFKAGLGVPNGLIETERGPGEGITGWVIEHGEAQNVPNTQNDKRHRALPGLEIASEICVPLRRGAETLGALTVKNRYPQAFSDDDLDLLMAVASQAAIAIERAKLNRRLEEVSRLALGNSFQDLANYVVDSVRDLTGADVVLWGIHTDTQTQEKFLEIRAHAGDFSSTYLAGARVPLDPEHSMTAQALQEGRPILRKDVVGDGALPKFYSKQEATLRGWRAFMAAPIFGEGKEWLGSMSLYSTKTAQFGTPELSLMQAFANQVAVAFENNRMHERSRQQLKTLQRIIEAMGSADALPLILEGAVSLFGAHQGSFSLFDIDIEHLVFYAIFENGVLHLWDEIPEERRYQSWHKGITGRVAHTGKSYRTGNVKDAGDLYDEWYASTVSELAVALRDSQDKVIGVLNLESTLPDAFSKEDEELCRSFADVASEAIEKARLLEIEQQLQRLHEVVQQQDIDGVLVQILEGLNSIAGEGASSSINLYDEETDAFGTYQAVGPLRDSLLVPPRPNGTGRHVIANQEPLFLTDVRNPPPGCPTIRDESKAKGIKSFAALPLKREGKIRGVLFVNITRPLSFTVSLRKDLELFASQVALVIENVQLISERRKRAKRLEQLRETMAAISERPFDLAAVLDIIAKQVLEMSRGASCTIRTYDVVKKRLGERVSVGSLASTLGSFTPRSGGTTEYLLQGNPMYVSDTSAPSPEGQPQVHPEVITAGVKALAYLPLSYEGEIKGVLYLNFTEPHRFDDNDRRILALFSGQAANAIHNAQLYTRLEHKVRNLGALYTMGQALTSAVQLSEREILGLIDEQASGLMDTNNMYVALYDAYTGWVRFPLMRVSGESVKVESRLLDREKQGRTEWIIQERKPLHIMTRAESEAWYVQSGREDFIKQPFASWIGVPMLAAEDVLGVVAAYHDTEEYHYDKDDLEVLTLIANYAAVALRSSQQLELMRDLSVDLSSSVLSKGE